MSDAPTSEKSSASCKMICGNKCWICCLLAALVLITLGTGIHAQWTAWARYKKFSADEYSITISPQAGESVSVKAGHYVKVFRVTNRVDVIKNDKSDRQVFFAPKRLDIKKK